MKALRNITTFAVLFFAFTLTAFASNNATISCASGPLRTTETYDPTVNTDDGAGRLQMTVNCTMIPNPGAVGYLSAWYSSGVVSILHPIDVTFTNGVIAVNNGSKAGWTFDLEIALPSGLRKHYKMNYNSGTIPAPNGQHEQSWPLTISLPAGSTFKVDIYGYADDVSWCASTCYGSAQWNLQ